MKKIKFFSFLCVFLLGGGLAYSQITWFSFDQALEMNAKRAEMGLPTKKIFVDIYTNWCGWCKRLDATTFAHQEIVRYMSDHFIAVKLNAEMRDTVIINNQMFLNRSTASRGTHDLAQILLKGKMSYPSSTFIDEKGTQIGIIPGYLGPKDFETVLHFYGEDAYLKESWESFQSRFKGNIKE